MKTEIIEDKYIAFTSESHMDAFKLGMIFRNTCFEETGVEGEAIHLQGNVYDLLDLIYKQMA